MTRSSGRRHQRSRAIIVWMVAGFVLLQAATGVLVDDVVPQVRFPELHRELARLPKEPHSLDLIALGSSRFQGLVNEAELSHELRRLTGQLDFRAQNCSVPGGDPIAQERVLQALLVRGVSPRFVLMESSPEFLNEFNEMYSLHAHRLLNWDDLPRHGYQLCLSGQTQRLIMPRLVPLMQHRYQLLKQLGTGFAPLAEPAPLAERDAMTDLEWNDLRFKPRPLSKEQEAGLYAVTAPDRPWLKHYRLAGNGPRAVEEMIDACKRRGIRPILVGAPVASVYRAKYTPAIQGAYVEFIERLKHQDKIDYLECRDAMPDHLFVDTHHAVSPVGGVVFSRILAREFLAPLITSPAPPIPATTVGFDKNRSAAAATER